LWSVLVQRYREEKAPRFVEAFNTLRHSETAEGPAFEAVQAPFEALSTVRHEDGKTYGGNVALSAVQTEASAAAPKRLRGPGGKGKAKIAAILLAGVTAAALALSFVIPGVREVVWGWSATKDLWILPASFAITFIVSLVGLIGTYWWDRKVNDPNQVKKSNKRARRRKD